MLEPTEIDDLKSEIKCIHTEEYLYFYDNLSSKLRYGYWFKLSLLENIQLIMKSESQNLKRP